MAHNSNMQKRDVDVLERVIKQLRANLNKCVENNRQWEVYVRNLEALHNEKVDIINQLQAELDALKGNGEIVQ